MEGAFTCWHILAGHHVGLLATMMGPLRSCPGRSLYFRDQAPPETDPQSKRQADAAFLDPPDLMTSRSDGRALTLHIARIDFDFGRGRGHIRFWFDYEFKSEHARFCRSKQYFQ